jgi:hypothetical protein
MDDIIASMDAKVWMSFEKPWMLLDEQSVKRTQKEHICKRKGISFEAPGKTVKHVNHSSRPSHSAGVKFS